MRSRRRAPVGRSEWREVGSLQPTFAADPGIRVQRFRGELAGSQLPPPILRPLGHERSADGPAGLVSGITRPVIARLVEGQQGAGSLPLARKRAGEHEPVPISAEASMSGTGAGGPLHCPRSGSRQLPVVSGASSGATIDHRGRRRDADRQGQRSDRHERADLATGNQSGRGGPVQEESGRAGHRGRNAEAARCDASRHDLHVRRPRLRAALSGTSSTTSRRSHTGPRTRRAGSNCTRTRSPSSTSSQKRSG